MGAPGITLVGRFTIKEEKRKRAEELWGQIVKHIAENEQGRIRFQVLNPNSGPEYIVIEEFSSKKVMEEWDAKPAHLEFSEAVRKEDLLAEKPWLRVEKPILDSATT